LEKRIAELQAQADKAVKVETILQKSRKLSVNLSKEDFIINDGDRIAQMIISSHEKAQWEEVKQLIETERGSGGFGHTGL